MDGPEMEEKDDATAAPAAEAPADAAVPNKRRANVEYWASQVRADKQHFKPVFDKMRQNMEVARFGSNGKWAEAGKYAVPLIMRHINQKVATLYARNPKAQAERRPRMEFQVWDGDIRTLQDAMSTPEMPQSAAVLADFETGRKTAKRYDNIARTLELLYQHFVDECEHGFKAQLKQAVRRANVCSVAYLKLGFQRQMEPRPEIAARMNDVTSQLQVLRRLGKDMEEGDLTPDQAEVDQLELQMAQLQSEQHLLVQEGPVFDFPYATEIIPHRRCRGLKGFIGADYVTHEYQLTADEVEEVYGVDVRKEASYRKADATEEMRALDDGAPTEAEKQIVLVWEIWCKKTRQVMTLADGYSDFLREPAAPEYQIDGFWPIFPLMFAAVEDEKCIYPESDVAVLMHPQMEYNRSREALRQHRRHGFPLYFAKKGALTEDDRDKLKAAEIGEVVELEGIDEDLTQLITPRQPIPVDAALYATADIMQDVYRSVGSDENNTGGVSRETATASSIAAQSRMTVQSSEIDELDEFLSLVARRTGQLLLLEMSADMVKRVVGPGAVWPQWSAEEVAREVYLTIKAGSAGRPNRAAELADFERVTPLLLQLPEINTQSIAKRLSDLVNIEFEDLIMEGAPSVTALNALAGTQVPPGTGDPATDPAAQGPAGAANISPAAPEEAVGPQPAYPAPTQFSV